jgi:hypothetical protein
MRECTTTAIRLSVPGLVGSFPTKHDGLRRVASCPEIRGTPSHPVSAVAVGPSGEYTISIRTPRADSAGMAAIGFTVPVLGSPESVAFLVFLGSLSFPMRSDASDSCYP